MKGKQQDFRTEKYIRYGIRKYSFGAASVAIAAGLMFLGNGAVAATEQNPVSDSKENIQKVENASPELGASTIQLTEKTAETPKKEEVQVNKSLLETSISNLETALSNAKYADASVVANAREALATAKAVLANETAKQEEINIQKDILSSLKTVVTESNKLGLETKEADKDKAAKEEAEKSITPTEKSVSAATTILTQVSSEADVTNTLAATELRKKEVSEENRVAVEAAVAKNQAVLNESKVLLADKSITKEQVDAQLERLNESILAVYSELKKAGIGRDGKFEVVLADLAEKVDEAPLTEAQQADHWKKYADKNTERLKHQIKWFDITSKTAVVENLGDGGKLKVGTKFKQELTPGYVVEMEVTALKPFNSTDVYKERGGAGYDANAKNVYSDGTEAEVKVVRQGGYSVAKTNGIDTGGTTVIQSVKNGANVGVEFKVKATLNGKEVPANVVFATGEEAGSSEIEIYKTDGDGFELVTELSNTNYRVPTARSYTAETYDNRYNLSPVGNGQGRQLGQSYSIEGKGKTAFEPFIADKAKGFRSTEITEETVSTVTDKDGKVYSDGLGTQVFGPAVTHRDSGMSTPVVLTRNAKNLGVYILSSGQQGAMFGFMVLDEGDAPASYGKVGHAIAKGAGITQPYLGAKEPDVDIRTEKITDETAFKYDDVNGEGGDEGARQLMGDKVAQGDNYKLKKVNAGTYSMTFDAHLGGGKNAFVNGWIDFNGNGKFDENEGAGAVEVTKDGEVTLTWTTPVQNVDVTATKLATRLRIANDKADVKEATGIAYSGEVEDFQIQQTIPPRGTKEETYDIQGATQNSTIKFNAYGNKDYNFEEKAAIDETVKPQIVKPDGSVVTDAELVDGYYVVPGQGKYKVTAKGKDVSVEFVPEATFVGDADGITIRRTDTNGATTGWGKIGKPIVNGEGNNGDQLTLISEQVTPEGASEKGSMDGRYIPHVMKREIVDGKEKSNDIQGAKQTRTPEFKDTANNKITPSEEFPAKLVDPKTGNPTDETEIPATKDGKTIGTYTITPTTGEVVFTPNKDFTGDPDPVKVSFTGKVGVDKDGNPVTSTGTVTYQPTVKPVTPTAEGGETTKPQGETQEQEITFTAGKNTVTYLDKNDNPVEVEKSVPMNPDAYTLLGEDGQLATEVPAKKPDGTVIGTYTLTVVDGIPTAVFTPTDKTYVGPVLPVTIQGEDENGTKATAKYTPHITPVEPTAQEAESTAKQGDTQKGKPTFTPGSENSTMKPETLTLVDDSGNPVETLPATDKNGNKVGDYTVDKTTGEVIFTPTNKTYAGPVLPARVRMQDSNGTPAETNYTPNIVPVRPQGQPAESKAPQGQTQEGTVSFTGGTVTVNGKEETVAIQEGTARLLDQNGNPLEPTAKQDVMGPDGNKIGEYSIDPTTNKVTYTPTDLQYTGKVPAAVVQALDVNGTPAVTTYTPSIIPETPTAEEATSIKPQGQVQKGTVTFTAGSEVTPIVTSKTTLLDENNQPAEEVPAKSPEGKVIGKYTLNKDTGEVTFTPDPTVPYAGDVVPVSVRGEDTNGSQVTTTYTPSIIPVNPSANPAKSEGPQGVEQSGTVEFIPGNPNKEPESPAPIVKSTIKLLDKSGNEAETVTVTKDGKEIGVYSLVKDENGVPTGEVKFTPTDKTYVGEVEPVTVQAKDTNSTVAKTTYTPKFTGVTPTGTPVESTGIQGKTQEGTPTFTAGDVKVPIKIDETQPATFYNPVTKEPIAETEIPATKDGKEVGKYKIDPKTGTVTFTPNKDFTGTPDPVTVQAKDANGTPATATYTPTVTPVTPTGTPVESTGIQGKTQEGTPTFTPGNSEVPITITDEQPATFYNPVTKEPITETEIPATKDGKEVGKYTIDPKSGKVTFTPNKDFTGTPDPVTVQVKDANGTPTTATYTPTVTPVTPEGKPAESTGIQGKTQEGTPTFTAGNPEVPITITDEQPAQFVVDGKPVTEKEIPAKDKDGKEVGKYTIDPKSGKVTFKPNKDFTGTPVPATVQVKDANATPTTATYTPTVTPVTPTAEGDKSTGLQGKVQTGTPKFTPGNPEVPMDNEVPATFEDGSTVKTVEGVGKFEVAKDGKVTFTPEKSFTGEAPAVTVKRVDKNGTPATATYTPTVTPVTPTSEGKTSEGAKGEVQTGKPTFTPGNPEVPMDDEVPATFEDGSTVKTVEGVGKFEVAKDGTVTFTPEKSFTGKAPAVTVKRVDKNGTPATATYTPTVRPDTKFVVVGKDGKETELIPSKDGEQPSEPVPGYKVVKTETDEKGNTKHIYEKVTTSFKDKEGNEIPGYPTEEGTTPKKDNIPGYRFVETKTLPNGDTEHVYEKVKTSFKDKEGNEIPGYPTEDGDQPKKDIPGYRFVETKKLPNGDVEHVYEKVKTSFKDKEGKEIPNYPTEDGDQPKKDIPGYRFVETKKLPNGDIEHIYEKVVTPTPTPTPQKEEKVTTYVDEKGNPIRPTKNGEHPSENIPEFELVRTEKDAKGNVRHVYRKVTTPETSIITTFVDENGNPILPNENGEVPAKDIPGYELVRTEKDANGNVRHVYRKVQETTQEQPAQQTAVKEAEGKRELPNTGTEANASLAALGLLGALSGFGLLTRKKKED
ncbi:MULTISPECIES: GEVED domain-containing protein [unclassified Streptococcus]|uniref:GEVED domain-containing protein n=1 Tax=unclassified Streptococcus TaxID=2608887 RepID=UPI0020C86D56|nr:MULTISPECIES: GEVED domain-containing protein [unclassified Streptococcus]MCP9060700.1 CshA/CshB family fibrillar adhesin-related protein [Streptococcus sp. CF7_Ac1-12]MCP9085282.1 CshA/CshB family fibrillar adhesin-related protein [Streptococcus sp. CF7_Ac1-8]